MKYQERVELLLQYFGELIKMNGENSPLTLKEARIILLQLQKAGIEEQKSRIVMYMEQPLTRISDMVSPSFFVTAEEALKQQELLEYKEYRKWERSHYICYGSIKDALANFRESYGSIYPQDKLNDWLNTNYSPNNPSEEKE